MSQIEDLIIHSGKITVSVISRTIFIVFFGGLLALILWLMLLPLFAYCGVEREDALKCMVLFVGILFLALVCPFLFFWYGKNYAIFKTLYNLYQNYKKPVLGLCAKEACRHKNVIKNTSKFKNNQIFRKLPFFIRLVLGKIDFSFLIREFQLNPNITPQELELKLEEHLQQKKLIEKPSLTFFWMLVGIMLGVFFGLKWWVVS